MRVPRRAPTARRRRRRRPPRRPRITVTATGTTARRTARRHRPDGRPIGDDWWHGGGLPRPRGSPPFLHRSGRRDGPFSFLFWRGIPGGREPHLERRARPFLRSHGDGPPVG